MIEMKTNLAVAHTLLQAINTQLLGRADVCKLIHDNTVWVECFDNCREQGYVIKVAGKKTIQYLNIAFSENRNTDQIVIYKYRKIRAPTNLPDEHSWDDYKYFSYGKYDEATDYIIKLIEEELQ